jgi:hypothetical protein
VRWGVLFIAAKVGELVNHCKITQPLPWLQLHAKGRPQSPTCGAGRPPLGRPAWGCHHASTDFVWAALITSRGQYFWRFDQPMFFGPGGLALEASWPSVAPTRSSMAVDPSLMGRHLVIWSWPRILSHCIWIQAFRFQLVHFGKLPIGMAWILPLDDFGKFSCQNST